MARHPADGRRRLSGADDWLGGEGCDIVWPESLEFGFQLGGEAGGELGLGFVIALEAVGEGGADMAEGGRQQGRVGRATGRVAAGGQRAERVAVIAAAPGDEFVALGLADFEKILPGKLDGGFGAFRSGGGKIGVGQPTRRVPDQHIGQFFRRLVAENRGVDIGNFIELGRYCVTHPAVAMAEARHRCAA